MNVNDDVALLMSAFLRSTSVSCLRACSRDCRSMFLRNCRERTSTQSLVIEALERPELTHFSFAASYANPHCRVEVEVHEKETTNPLSPLRAFEIEWRWAGALSRCDDEPTRCLVRRLFQDRDFVVDVVKHYGQVLEFAADAFQRDRDVVFNAVSSQGMALQWAHSQLRRDQGVVSAAVAADGWALQYADPTLKADKNVLLAAVSQNKKALMFADKSIRGDQDLRLRAGLLNLETRPTPTPPTKRKHHERKRSLIPLFRYC